MYMNKDSSNRPNFCVSSQIDLISVLHAQASTSEACNTLLQHAATSCNDFSYQICLKRAMYSNRPQLTVAQTRASSGEDCTTPSHTATHCNELHHTATISHGKRPLKQNFTPEPPSARSAPHCNTLQHTATCYNCFS